MPTTSKLAFDRTLKRVGGMLALHPRARGRPKQHISDVMRGGLVLAVAALDAFVADSIAHTLPKLIRQGRAGSEVLAWLKNDAVARRVVESMADGSGPTIIGEVAREQLGTRTFQKARSIEKALHQTCDCSPPWGRAAKLLTARTGDVWNTDHVQTLLDDFVDRRNKIAHEGDLVPPKRTKTTSIQLPYVQRAVRVIQAVGDGIEAEMKVTLSRNHTELGDS